MIKNQDDSITLTRDEVKILLIMLNKFRKVFDKISCCLAPDIKSSDLQQIDTFYGNLHMLVRQKEKIHNEQ